MVAPSHLLSPISSRVFPQSGVQRKAAHAQLTRGRSNALDAAVMAYNSVSVLRQQMKPDWRVHGIISNGGAKPNISLKDCDGVHGASSIG